MNGHSYAIQEEYSNAAGSCVINAPAAEVAYTHLAVNVSHGWTRISWKATRKVTGFNVYFKGKRLNKHLVTSRTLNYHFKVHAIAPHPIPSPIL
jgi:pantothenate kinase